MRLLIGLFMCLVAGEAFAQFVPNEYEAMRGQQIVRESILQSQLLEEQRQQMQYAHPQMQQDQVRPVQINGNLFRSNDRVCSAPEIMAGRC